MRPLYSHPLESIPDELVQALAKLRGRLSHTSRAARVKKTAAQAGLSAGPAVSEALLRKVVMGLKRERAVSKPSWYAVCTKLANIAVANGYKDVGLRIFHEFSQLCPAKYDRVKTDAKFARAVRDANPQWGFAVLQNMLRKDNPALLRTLRNHPAWQGFFREHHMSVIEAKLKKFYLPDITAICGSCVWALHKCHEPQLEDYSQETAPGVVIWSKPATGESRL